MKQTLLKIENWLVVNADKIINHSLQEPTTIAEINKLEKIIGRSLPNDFKELYLWHNGLNDKENIGSLFYGMDFLPIEEIVSGYLDIIEIYSNLNIPLKNFDKEIDPANIYNIYWIKFAFDGSHTSLYLDLTPSSKGNYGQIIFIDDEFEMGILVAHSTTDLIKNFCNDLEKGLYCLNEDALKKDHHYLTPSPKIDIVNWLTSVKWSR